MHSHLSLSRCVAISHTHPQICTHTNTHKPTAELHLLTELENNHQVSFPLNSVCSLLHCRTTHTTELPAMGCPGAVTELCQIVGVEGERDLGTSRLLLSIQGLSRRCSLPPMPAARGGCSISVLFLCRSINFGCIGERKAHQTGTSVHSIQPKKGGLTLCVCQQLKSPLTQLSKSTSTTDVPSLPIR